MSSLAFVLCLCSLLLLLRFSSSTSSIKLSCTAKSIVRYRVTFLAEWTEERFYKMYPRVRPPAQWSKVLGRSHDERYTLWREGDLATEGLKNFAEKRDSTLLDLETQGSPTSLLDVFSMPPLTVGYGNESVVFFADNKRHFVSIAAKLHPSPDWFVGVDTLNLCESRGSTLTWKDQEIVELFPHDAGTDDGFTFTAPNWATVPQARITRITHLKPDHDASSFFYPEKDSLPRIGALIFTREDLYHKGISGTSSDSSADELIRDIGFTTPKTQTKPTKATSPSRSPSRSSSFSSPSGGDIASSKFNPKAFTFPKQKVGGTDAWWLKTHKLPVLKHPEDPKEELQKKKPVFSSFDLLSASAKKRLRPRRPSSSSSSSSSSSTSYRPISRNSRGRGKPSFKFSLGNSNRNSNRPTKINWKEAAKARKDCLVTEWSAWSPCSKTCGFGQRTRRREVTQAASSGGLACPKLMESETCGSMRGCGWKHFSSDNWENMTYEPTMRRMRRRRRL